VPEGWIKLHRKVKEHWLYTKPRVFSEFEAWIYLLLTVNHSENKFYLGNELMEVDRGSIITSLKILRERWGWSNTKVVNFLKILESDGMITYKSDAKKTALSIVNYCIYQDYDVPKNDGETTEKRCIKDAEKTEKHTNNNVKECIKNEKNEKNEKIKYAEFVAMTNAEYEKLVSTYGRDRVFRMIEVLDNYKGSSGKKYKNDYRAMLNWVAERVLKEKANVVSMPNAGAYKEDSQKCPFCKDTGWVINEGHEMVRCKCQEVRVSG